jgi:hypothetical protein
VVQIFLLEGSSKLFPQIVKIFVKILTLKLTDISY